MDLKQITDYLFQMAASFGMKLIAAIVVLLLGLKFIKILRRWIERSKKLDKIDQGVRTFLASFSQIALYVILFLTVAVILGIPTTSFITALASCGVAIGLALQGALSNVAGGIMILIFKPFKVSDYIATTDASGEVYNISIIYTVLKTPDNKFVTIPNGTLTNSVIENYSTSDTRRVDLNFSVGYDSDIEKVRDILIGAMKCHEKVLCDTEPVARLSRHADSALEFTARAWCNSEDYWDVYFDLLEDVKKKFDENKISIPYPQVDVHINNK